MHFKMLQLNQSLNSLVFSQGLSKQCPFYGAKNSVLQFSFEAQSLYMYFVWLFDFAFALLLSHSNSFAVAFLPIKSKRFLHVSYMQLFTVFEQITHNIYNIYKYTKDRNLKP